MRSLLARVAGFCVARPAPVLAAVVLLTVLGAVAALLLLGAGVLLATRGHRMPRMGSRYQPGPRRGAPSMWDELDAGRDPTG